MRDLTDAEQEWVTAVVVAARFASNRGNARKNTQPINPPKGIAKDIANANGETQNVNPESVKPGRRDIRPEDVFPNTPDSMGVLNLAQTGKDLSKALDRQIPHDKGYDAVKNLSQYLIRTDGGGSGSPAGKR